MTVPPVALQSFNAHRPLYEAYPTLIAPPSMHTVRLLEAINGLSLQVDAKFNALTTHFNDRYNQLDERINELASRFRPSLDD
ncbi:hypothetical protein PVK06_028162 [Gossypium arboreum]|uniref:Uncharacterized protein n=1 Tax=Gossypium arboreum TaxID=29729 RepID=A0ABR0P488_GOSAR|nr:hypothetical protein PVK06_028162 [Gossypium arboreum]